MEPADDVTVRRDDVRAALRLLVKRGRRAERAVWVLPSPEPGTVLLGHGTGRHTVPVSGAWGTPAEIDAGCFVHLFGACHLPDLVRLTMFGGVFMVGRTVIEPPPIAKGGADPHPGQGVLFPPAVMRTLAPRRRR